MMTRHKIVLLLMVCLGIFLGRIEAQKNDYRWIFGQGTCLAPSPPYGVRDLVFGHGDEPQIVNTCRTSSYFNTNTNYSDGDGQLRLHTNGLDLYSASGQVIFGGDSLLNMPYYGQFTNTGHRLPGATMLLGYPGGSPIVHLLHLDYTTFNAPWGPDGTGQNLYLTTVDLSLNGGLGAVVQHKDTLVRDSLTYANLNACRHANGRDWWVIIFEEEEDCYYSVLLTPYGAQTVNKWCTMPMSEVLNFGGQTSFSPDGNWYARADGVNGLYVWRFDRCTGMLGVAAILPPPPPGGFTVTRPFGIAFSPNSGYLYWGHVLGLSQLDLALFPQLNMETVATGSDTCVATGNCPDSTGFFRAMGRLALGPDGRIYITKGGQDYYPHRIHRPNLPGTACTVRQLDFLLPNYINYEFPLHPHYRLGPLDGSACDTLGLDQPLAVHAERLDFGPVPLGSAATLSFWLRNPGEGALVVDTFRFDSAQYASPLPLPFTVAPGDSVQVPVTFAPTALPLVEAQLRVFHNGIAGISTVQLTGLGDSVVSALPTAATVPGLVLWPNPTSGGVQVAFTSARAFDTEAVLYDALGRAVLALPVQVVAGSNRFALPLEGLPGGVYSVMLRGVGAGRVVKN